MSQDCEIIFSLCTLNTTTKIKILHNIFYKLNFLIYFKSVTSHFCLKVAIPHVVNINPLKPELNPICYLLTLLGAHHFLHVSRIRVKLLTFRRLMSYIYIHGEPILDVSRSHTTTQHSR